MRRRLGIIGMFVLLFVAFILIWNYSYQKGLQEAEVPVVNKSPERFLPSEQKLFEGASPAIDYASLPVDPKHERTLSEYYANRAYPGAPPYIPHPVETDFKVGGNLCLQCHMHGGFVPKYSAYAPPTPHPEMVNCRQCHVSRNTPELFKPSDFQKPAPPGVGGNNALPGSPPQMPHGLQMRENCISCHAGPAAPREIRTTHPERVNCRQCHLPNQQQGGSDIKAFIKQYLDATQK